MANYRDIAGFIDTHSNRYSRMFGYLGLCIGSLLLFSSLQFYIDINHLIKERKPGKDGFTYISVTKEITNQNMGKDNRFTTEDLDAIKSVPGVDDAAALISNQFRAKVSAGNIIPFSTDLFLEAINDKFLDTLPANFKWAPGQYEVPIIMSSDFLEMYNIFAPAQDLPQISGETAGSVNVQLECYGTNGISVFRGHIVGLSDRINSILVPESFLIWANKVFGHSENPPFSRIYIKTRDAGSVSLMNYIDAHHLHINKERNKAGRIKQVLQGVITGLGGFALLIVVLAILLFSFYIQLLISRSRENLKLLVMLGYDPVWLGKQVSRRWIPGYVIIVLLALTGTFLLHLIFRSVVMEGTERIGFFISIYTLALAAVIFAVCILVNNRLLKKELVHL